MTNIKIIHHSINNSKVPNDYFLSTCRMNFSLNLREMENGVQTKSSDRMYKFYLQSVPRKMEHKEKWVPVNTKWEN